MTVSSRVSGLSSLDMVSPLHAEGGEARGPLGKQWACPPTSHSSGLCFSPGGLLT